MWCGGAAVARPAGAGRVELLAADGSTIVVRRRRSRAAGRWRAPSRRAGTRSRCCTPTSPTRRARDAWRRAAAGELRRRRWPRGRARAGARSRGRGRRRRRRRGAAGGARRPRGTRATCSPSARARAGAPFTVVSPVPTVEAKPSSASRSTCTCAGRRSARAGHASLVVDRREQPPGAGLLTEPLADALRGADGLAVCVLNRRGRFRMLACDACHELLRWDRNADRPVVCPACGEARLRVVRAGVKRVRRGARRARSRASTWSTSTPTPGRSRRTSTSSSVPKRCCTGASLRRRRPTLVAYLDFDQELLAPRYRAVDAGPLARRARRAAARRPPALGDAARCCRRASRITTSCAPSRRGRPRLVIDARDRIGAARSAIRRSARSPSSPATTPRSPTSANALAALDALRSSALGPSDGRVLVQSGTWDELSAALHATLPAARAAGRLRVVVDPPRV